MSDEYTGGGIIGPAGGYDSWGPPGPGFPGGLWIPIEPPPGFVFPSAQVEQPPPVTPPVVAQPPVVEQLPPPEHNTPPPVAVPPSSSGGGGERQPDVPITEDYFENLPPGPDIWPPLGEPDDDPRAESPPEARQEEDGPPGSGPKGPAWPFPAWPPGPWPWPNTEPPAGFPFEIPGMQFVPRPTPPRPRPDQPAEFPTLPPRWPFVIVRPRPGRRRGAEIGPPGTPPLPNPNEIPYPLPEEMNPNPEPPWPRVREFPPVPPLEAIPQPSLPETFPIEQPAPLPLPEPDASPIPRAPPPAPTAPPPTQPQPQTFPARVAVPNPLERLFVIPLRRRSGSQTRDYPWQAFDPLQPPVADFPTLPAQPITPPAVSPPATLPTVPDLFPDLTPLNATPLSFAQPGTRTDECKCEDEESERREPRPSNVIANVKPYRRRMSLNSLENLE